MFDARIAYVVVFFALLWMVSSTKESYDKLPRGSLVKVPTYGPFSIRIGESTCVKGQRGVFATADFQEGDVVEKCPCVLVPSDMDLGGFNEYTFDAGKGKQGLAFGYGCMYNHSKKPNVEFDYDRKTNTKTYTALRDIAAGEELFSSYGSGWWKGRKGFVSC
jgi:uncharacterized protein